VLLSRLLTHALVAAIDRLLILAALGAVIYAKLSHHSNSTWAGSPAGPILQIILLRLVTNSTNLQAVSVLEGGGPLTTQKLVLWGRVHKYVGSQVCPTENPPT